MRVVDASFVVAWLLDSEADGLWAGKEVAASGGLVAPHLMPAEVTSVLRRAVAARDITADAAALALDDLDALGVSYFPFAPFGGRVWELRHNLSAYDAWYVAIAEQMEVDLLSLDRRLAAAPGVRCRVLVPP